jgi:hypothetical protein
MSRREMNRREFSVIALGALGVVALGTLPVANASPERANFATDTLTNQKFRYRFRYARKQGTYWTWLRVSDVNDLQADVPVSLAFSTDPAGQNLVGNVSRIARSLDSHVVRTKILIDSQKWPASSPLFLTLHIGNSGSRSKVYRVWRG